MRYFIIGFKSSGKTTMGKKLAELLNMKFVDLDDEIEKTHGRSVPEIFAEDGEEEFRKIEWKALNKIVATDNIVVSTGGGAPCHCDNMALMEDNGDIIYLKLPDEILVNRLMKVVTERPIVKNKTKEELYLYVRDLRSRCEHLYLKARYTIDGENVNLNDLVSQLKNNRD